jgi:predicted RNase H-like HicB family nuclease
MHRYVILIEPNNTGFSSFSPDLPGCVATGPTAPAVQARMKTAIEMHLRDLRDRGQPIPPGTTSAAVIEVAA